MLGCCTNLAVIVSLDGSILFPTSSISMWPITGTLQNLAATERDKQENILLFGMYVDNHSPSTELITSRFGELMRENFSNGLISIYSH
jgi:hypothetical protein